MYVLSIIKYWKCIFSSAVAMAIGFGAAWYIQGLQVKYGKLEISNLKSQLKRCEEANVENQKRISSLESELVKLQRLCKSRLEIKDRVIKRLQEIEGLKVLNDDLKDIKKEVKDEEGPVAVDDPVLLELNRMFNKADTEG